MPRPRGRRSNTVEELNPLVRIRNEGVDPAVDVPERL